MEYTPGYGPIGAKLVILGESPSLPFTKELDTLLLESGIRRSDCWITNVCKYEIPIDPEEKIPFGVRAARIGIDVPTQLEELQNEINSIKPNCILALGSTALWATTGKKSIKNYRGSILHGMGTKVVSTYHPYHLTHQKGGEFSGFWNRPVMVFDMKRAVYQSTFSEIVLPSRSINICTSSYQFDDFIRRHKDKTKMAADIEAIEYLPGCIGLAFNSREALVISLWNTIKGIPYIPDSDLIQIWIMLSNLLMSKDIIGQNFKYDEDKLKRIGFTIKRLISDTMLKAFAINPELPVSLAFNTSIYTEEPFYKDEGMYEGSPEDLLIGCGRDACVTYEIDEKMDEDLDSMSMRPFYNNFLMKLHPLYLEIENTGFKVDPQAREELMRKYIEWDERINFKLFKLIGNPINTMSNTQVPNLLYEVMKLPPKKGAGEEVITQFLNSPKVKDEHKEILELILESRRVRKTINTYLMAMPDYDGRMKTTYFLCLKTGRTSTGQQDPPIRPKFEYRDFDNKKKTKPLGTAFQTITKHGDIGSDVRRQYIPDEGEIFLQADSAQAEARVVFLLANDEEALKLIDERDYHAITASWFFGGTESDYSKKVLGYESPIRFAGKTLRHAGHLGAGKKRAAAEVNTQARKYKIPIQITETIADAALKVFHKKQPSIQGVFHAGIIEALRVHKRTLTAGLPYGIDAPNGGKRIFYERWNDELFREAFSYIPQRSVSDNTKAAMLRIKERAPWIKIIIEAHDGILASVPIYRKIEAALIMKEEMERPISFAVCSLPRRDLIIPCEIEEGMNYRDLSKFKFYEMELK